MDWWIYHQCTVCYLVVNNNDKDRILWKWFCPQINRISTKTGEVNDSVDDGYKCGSRPLQQYVFLSSIDVFMYIYIYIYFYELVNTLVRCDPNYDVCVWILWQTIMREPTPPNNIKTKPVHTHEVGITQMRMPGFAGGKARVDAWRPCLMTSFLRSVGVHVTSEQSMTWIQKRGIRRHTDTTGTPTNQPTNQSFHCSSFRTVSDDVDTEMGTSKFHPKNPTKPTHPWWLEYAQCALF